MKKKFSLKLLLISIGIVVIISSAIIIFVFIFNSGSSDSEQISQNSNSNTPSEIVAVQEEKKSELPVRIVIPKIKVDAAFEYVSTTSEGAMDVPKDPNNVAWFNLGRRPGEIGTAVMAGHYGWQNSIPAVFDNLNTLVIGDKIYVEDENRMITIFVVREIRTYTLDDNHSDVFNSNDGQAHLNLITCSGTWSKEQQSYSDRIVVFTDKEI